MSSIKFHISEEQVKTLTWEDYESIERAQDGDVKMYLLRPLLARFVVDDNLSPLPHDQALKSLAKVPLTEVPNIIRGFMDVLKERAIPKASGEPSASVSIQADVSPVGAIPS